MAKTILNFHFDYLKPSLSESVLRRTDGRRVQNSRSVFAFGPTVPTLKLTNVK